ncbi:MAG: endonuclease/exonuclease/phosphatase family protein [Planctomycetaceae bacterium]
MMLNAFARPVVLSVLCLATTSIPASGDEWSTKVPEGTFRVATFNCSLNRDSDGQLIRDLSNDQNQQARKVARILRIVRPDIVLLNEFDYDADQTALRSFQKNYLEAEADWCPEAPLKFADAWSAPVNTGVPSGRDLDHDGKTDGPGDAIGFGRYPGQYGMAVLSAFPVDRSGIRTFQKLLWRDMPGAMLPPTAEAATARPNIIGGWYSEEDLSVLCLSSKSHWDVPIDVNGVKLHVLTSHPTPPAFDGPEDRNGRRNHDEIRLWSEYLSGKAGDWLRDDSGKPAALDPQASFIILGDQNADPVDGGSVTGAIQQLLEHPRVNSTMIPTSPGAVEASANQKQVNMQHRGVAAHDTSDFNDRSVGNLRVDYVLPSKDLIARSAFVYWPEVKADPQKLVECSDHRLVWIDLQLPGNTEK